MTPTHLRTTGRLAVAAAASVAALVAVTAPALAAPTPQVVAGNPTCADIAPDGTTWTEAKLDFNPEDGKSYTVGNLTVAIEKADDGSLGWNSGTTDIAAVIMKGGPDGNVYVYGGTEDFADDGLTPPINPNNGTPYGISHVSFCIGTAAPSNTPTPDPEDPAPQVNPDPQPAPAPQVAPAVAATPAPAAAQVLGVQVERPAVAGAQLAATGVDTTTLAVIGLALVLVGGVAVLPVTRRRAARD